MYEEDRIFGPLTFKQFLCAAAGAGAFYLVERLNLSESMKYFSWLIIGVATIVSFARFTPKKIPIEHIDIYFQNKRIQLGEENFKRFIQKKVAEVSSQTAMREEKGLRRDPELDEVLLIFEKALNIPNKNN